jgi:glucose/arabinose dehydrogenase
MMATRSCVLLALLLIAACGRTPPPTPSPPTTDSGEAITGRERLGWDQQASDAAELATFRYAVYVDGVRSELADVSCGTTAGPAGFPCTGRLPAMSNGAHTLELAAFLAEAAGALESGKSAPLRVTVTAIVSPPDVAPLATGEILTTADRLQLQAALLVRDLGDVVDLAVLPDGRTLIAERAGRILVVGDGAVADAFGGRGPSPADGGIVSLAVDPGFARSGHVFVVHAPAASFRLVRYRLTAGALAERMALMRDLPASSEAAAILRVGPDRKLYAGFDDGGSREAAARPSEWSGKILRLNPDGGTPDDQPAASPVYWSGLRLPRGMAWMPDDGTLWLAEERGERVERLATLAAESMRPRRAAARETYPLPQPFGARALAFHRGDAMPELRGNLFVAANDAGYLLRVRFDPADPRRIATTERLLEHRIGPVRAVAVAPDGSLRVASDSALWRLSRAR